MSSKPYILKTYVIHDESLRFRETNLNNTLKVLRMACDKVGIGMKTVMVTKPNIDTLQQDIKSLQDRVKYEKIDDPEFDNRMHTLSITMISNIEKHKEAWRLIMNDHDTNSIPLVLEDDAFLMPDFFDNLVEFIRVMPTVFSQTDKRWDICFLGNTKGSPDKEITFSDTRELSKILVSKESYIVMPSITRRLINSLDKMRYTLRNHMSWFIHTNRDIKSVFPSRPMFLDGSKIGICCSSIHPMNPLVLNKEFMELWHMKEKNDVPVAQIRALYKKIEHIQSPDIMHLYGVLLAERGEYNDAEQVLMDAIKRTKIQNGFLGSASRLLTDAIDNYKNLQRDTADLSHKPSKYSVPDMD